MNSLINNFINSLLQSFNDRDKESFKLIQPASDQKINLLLLIYPDVPDEFISLLKIVNGSSFLKDPYSSSLDFFQLHPGCDNNTSYKFCTIEEILEHKLVGDYSWLSLYCDATSNRDRDDIVSDTFGDEINPDALVKDRLLFAETSYSQLYIDFRPSELGKVGQIIAYVHDPDEYFQVADSFAEFLEHHIERGFDSSIDEETVPFEPLAINTNDNYLSELIDSFNSIPIYNNSLNLRAEQLSKVPIKSLSKLFAAIPRFITSLQIESYKFIDLAEAFEFLPVSLVSINLTNNELGYIKGPLLAEMFSLIPRGVTTLHLKYNYLNQCNADELARALEALPQNLVFLDLSSNKLGRFFCSQLNKIFQAIPRSVTTLDLSESDLYSKPGNELVYAFSIIPDNVITLNLRYNSLDSRRGNGLEEALKKLPANITQIDLNDNQY